MSATQHGLKSAKLPPEGPKMANGVYKGVELIVFKGSQQLLKNNFFDPKGCDKEWNGIEKSKNRGLLTSLSVDRQNGD